MAEPLYPKGTEVVVTEDHESAGMEFEVDEIDFLKKGDRLSDSEGPGIWDGQECFIYRMPGGWWVGEPCVKRKYRPGKDFNELINELKNGVTDEALA